MLTAAVIASHAPIAMADTVQFNCKFDKMADADNGVTGTRSGGGVEAQFFVEIDGSKIIKNARTSGLDGDRSVTAIAGPNAFTFIIQLPTGGIYSTTISGHEAVHSRHAIVNGTLVPYQLYGTCSSSRR
jgi:hypothetical protein